MDLNIAAKAKNKDISSSSHQEFLAFAEYQASAKVKAERIEALRKEGLVPPSYA